MVPELSKIVTPQPCYIGDVPVHPIRHTQLRAWILQAIAHRRRVAVMYNCPRAVNLAQRDPAFRAAMNSADVVTCDGQSIRLAARLLGCWVPERFTPPDWIEELAAQCAAHDYRFFFLGARPGWAEQAAERLRSRVPGLAIAAHHGYFATDGPENDEVIQLINAFGTNVLLVGMGMPRQEGWVQANLSKLSVNVVMTVGGMFDTYSGNIGRWPRWLTDNGLEWLSRVWYEPRRLGPRYLLDNAAFIWLVVRERLRMEHMRLRVKMENRARR